MECRSCLKSHTNTHVYLINYSSILSQTVLYPKDQGNVVQKKNNRMNRKKHQPAGGVQIVLSVITEY